MEPWCLYDNSLHKTSAYQAGGMPCGGAVMKREWKSDQDLNLKIKVSNTEMIDSSLKNQ